MKLTVLPAQGQLQKSVQSTNAKESHGVTGVLIELCGTSGRAGWGLYLSGTGQPHLYNTSRCTEGFFILYIFLFLSNVLLNLYRETRSAHYVIWRRCDLWIDVYLGGGGEEDGGERGEGRGLTSFINLAKFIEQEMRWEFEKPHK